MAYFKTIRRMILTLLCIVLLLPFAFASAETDLKQEDAEIKAAMKNDDFGYGDKLAFYDWTTDTYSYHGVSFPDYMVASSPEEIGAFISYHPADLDESGKVRIATTLDFAFDREMSYQFIRPERSVSITCYTDDPLKRYDSPYLYSTSQSLEAAVWRFFGEARPILTYLHEIRNGLVPDAGGGNRMIGMNLDTGEYSFLYVPREMVAGNNEQLGFILEYTIREVPVEGEYQNAGVIHGTSELFTYTIRNILTGDEVASGTVGGTAPFVLLDYSGNPDNGFQDLLSPEAVVDDLLDRYVEQFGSGRRSSDRPEY